MNKSQDFSAGKDLVQPLCFTNEKKEAERLSDLSKIMELTLSLWYI